MSTNTTDRTASAGTDARREVVVKCPATAEVVGSVPVATADEVETVAARLRAAQPGVAANGRRWPRTVAG